MPRITEQSRIIITGASSGIGAEIARQLAAKGARIALLARRQEMLEGLAKEVEAAGGKGFPLTCDVGDRSSVKDAFTKALDLLGGVDIGLLNAGVGKPTPATKTLDVEGFEWIFRINVLGLVYGIEQLLPPFLEQGRGTIVGVSSLAAYRGLPVSTAYGASKAAATNMLEGMRIELAPKNVRVITVSPGFVETPLTDKNNFKMPFLWKVDRAARVIVRGIERDVREVVFPLPLRATLGLARAFPNAVWDTMAGLAAPRQPDKG